MDYVVDTVALVRYLEDELPAGANRALRAVESGKARAFLPEIVLAEFIYTALKGKLDRTLASHDVEEVTEMLLGSSMWAIRALPEAAWRTMVRVTIPELHDRMIAAEAIARDATLISNDPSFTDVPGLQVIWK